MATQPGHHPGHPTAVGGLPASKPGLDAGAHDLCGAYRTARTSCHRVIWWRWSRLTREPAWWTGTPSPADGQRFGAAPSRDGYMQVAAGPNTLDNVAARMLSPST